MAHISPTLPRSAFVAPLGSVYDFNDVAAGFRDVQCRHDVADAAFWCFLHPQGRPSFTPGLLAELARVQDHIALLAGSWNAADQPLVRWVVLASRTPGVFSLGGDLPYFASLIRGRDHEGLRRYAHQCVDIGFRNATAYGAQAVTVGLAQGDALGGGFESLLSCDVIVAERRARFGLPEVLMNMFPGMGAHCFLTRRLGSAAAATRMILSGQVYGAEAMRDMGIVDLVVEDGTGEAAVQDYIARHNPRHRAHAATYAARRRVSPVTLEEMRDVTDIWVDTALALTEHDLRRMGQLAAAQDRTLRRQSGLSQAPLSQAVPSQAPLSQAAE